MMLNPEPKFQPGDRVESFRGDLATVVTVRKVETPGKSHRMTVRFDGAGMDSIEYYEEVFRIPDAERGPLAW